MTRNVIPGYCIIEQAGTLDFQARQLFHDVRSPSANLFMKLNADTQWLKPGQIVIVSDAEAPLTRQMLYTLREVKQHTNAALIGISTDEASFLQKHYGMIAGLTQAGGKIFGTVGDTGEKYFSAIERTLKKIEASYQNQFRTQGTLIGQQFFIERNQLLEELKELVNKPLLKSVARHTIKFEPYDDMRKALKLSSRSIVHEWSTVGMSGIPGYATFVGNAAKAARYLKLGGYIGIGFSFAGKTNDIVTACTSGREQECGTFAFKEYMKFAAETGAGIGAGTVGSVTGLAVCTAIGIATVGVGGVACAAVGSMAGGYVGSQAAGWIMDTIYRHTGM